MVRVAKINHVRKSIAVCMARALALSRRRRRITHTLQLNSTQYTPGRTD
jgi:hypothetical protein